MMSMFPNKINHANDDDLHNTGTEVGGLLSPWRAGLGTAQVPGLPANPHARFGQSAIM
jgi:hypothetical protein